VQTLARSASKTQAAPASCEDGPPLADLEVVAQVQLAAPVVHVAVAKVRTRRDARIAVGLQDGSACCLSRAATLLWKKTVGTGPARVACADLDGDGVDEIIATATGEEVIAFRLDGSMLWQATCDGDAHLTHFVKTGDLDQDGSPEVVVGKESLYVFDCRGELRWRHLKIDLRKRKIVVTQAALADFTGDGSLEIACATRYPAQLWILDAQQRHVFTKGRLGKNADTCGQSVQLDAFDGNGDGKAEMYNAVVFGACRHQPSGHPDAAWKRNAATAITNVPAKRRGRSLVMATETGDLIRIHDWRNAWHVQLDAPALLLASSDSVTRSPVHIAAALQTGGLVIATAEGRRIAHFSQGTSVPTALLVSDLDGDGRPEFLLGREDGNVFVVREKRGPSGAR